MHWTVQTFADMRSLVATADVRLQRLATETSGTFDDFRRRPCCGEEQSPGGWWV